MAGERDGWEGMTGKRWLGEMAVHRWLERDGRKEMVGKSWLGRYGWEVTVGERWLCIDRWGEMAKESQNIGVGIAKPNLRGNPKKPKKPKPITRNQAKRLEETQKKQKNQNVFQRSVG